MTNVLVFYLRSYPGVQRLSINNLISVLVKVN